MTAYKCYFWTLHAIPHSHCWRANPAHIPTALWDNSESSKNVKKGFRIHCGCLATTAGIMNIFWAQFNPEPYHNSMLTGEAWVRELKQGHSSRMRDNLGVNRHVFSRLWTELCQKGGLCAGRSVGTNEKLAIFLDQLLLGTVADVDQVSKQDFLTFLFPAVGFSLVLLDMTLSVADCNLSLCPVSLSYARYFAPGLWGKFLGAQCLQTH